MLEISTVLLTLFIIFFVYNVRKEYIKNMINKELDILSKEIKNESPTENEDNVNSESQKTEDNDEIKKPKKSRKYIEWN